MMDAFELLYQCYTTGQMTDRQLQEHLREDQRFREWLERRLGRPVR
mgnify:CR=1 FL=1|jgi:hypothetical protein